jgi:5'-3' exonuclease
MRLLIDSASLWYRAFYGMPDNFHSKDGLPVNAIKGFYEGLAVLIQRYRPSEIGICLDGQWRPSWRVALFPGYKLNRVDQNEQEDEPDLLTPQIEPLLELAELAGLEVIGADDYEADDVIATLALDSKAPVRVATGDRDLFQLLQYSDELRIIYLAKGITSHDLVDRDYVSKKYLIPAERYALYAAIRGDASDGLPGIRGIGEKGAAAIVSQFSSIDEIIEAARNESAVLKPLHRKKILEDLDYAMIAEKLVHCATDVPLPEHNLSQWRDKADLIAFRKLGKDLGLGSTVEKISAALDLK